MKPLWVLASLCVKIRSCYLNTSKVCFGPKSCPSPSPIIKIYFYYISDGLSGCTNKFCLVFLLFIFSLAYWNQTFNSSLHKSLASRQNHHWPYCWIKGMLIPILFDPSGVSKRDLFFLDTLVLWLCWHHFFWLTSYLWLFCVSSLALDHPLWPASGRLVFAVHSQAFCSSRSPRKVSFPPTISTMLYSSWVEDL